VTAFLLRLLILGILFPSEQASFRSATPVIYGRFTLAILMFCMRNLVKGSTNPGLRGTGQREEDGNHNMTGILGWTGIHRLVGPEARY
jgi:hypothetical protein